MCAGRRPVLALATLVLFLTAGCGNDSTPPGGTATSSEAFCAHAAELDAEMPESYVGSDAHLSDLDRLVAVAPVQIREDLVDYRNYVDESVKPFEPDSVLVENWPSDIQVLVADIQRFHR